MKRRDFLSAASSMMLPMMAGGFGVKAFGQNSPLVKSLTQMTGGDDRVLVLIYLNGGNDGLNTVIPIAQHDIYKNTLRSNIAIPLNQILRVKDSRNPDIYDDNFGFHPSMTKFRDLYDSNKLSIVHSVSYPEPNFSHQRSSEILMTAFPAVSKDSGWAGNYLATLRATESNENAKYPHAIQIGPNQTITLANSLTPAICVDDLTTFPGMIGNSPFLVPGSEDTSTLSCSSADARNLIEYIRTQQNEAVSYASTINSSLENTKYMDQADGTALARQLRLIARMIKGGLRTKVYFVELSGFDLHGNQTGSETTPGSHAYLLKTLSDAVFNFQSLLEANNIDNRVLGMTFSDFGRRASSNAGVGTDHGIAAPMFVFGKEVRKKTIGTMPILTTATNADLVDAGGGTTNIKMQIDFRRVYSDVLTDWFGNTKSTTAQNLYGTFDTVSLFKDDIETIATGDWNNKNIWSSGRVPYTNEIVKINNGHTVGLKTNSDITVKKLYLDGVLDNRTYGVNINITG